MKFPCTSLESPELRKPFQTLELCYRNHNKAGKKTKQNKKSHSFQCKAVPIYTQMLLYPAFSSALARKCGINSNSSFVTEVAMAL